jgi:hypothetical protein
MFQPLRENPPPCDMRGASLGVEANLRKTGEMGQTWFLANKPELTKPNTYMYIYTYVHTKLNITNDTKIVIGDSKKVKLSRYFMQAPRGRGI